MKWSENDAITTGYTLMRRGNGPHRTLILCLRGDGEITNGQRYYLATTTSDGTTLGLTWHEECVPEGVKRAAMGDLRN